MSNFSRLMPGVFESRNWDRALLSFAEICKENHIAWFLTGSACDAVRGINVFPHDLDIQARYETELARDRKERIAAIENFISENIV